MPEVIGSCTSVRIHILSLPFSLFFFFLFPFYSFLPFFRIQFRSRHAVDAGSGMNNDVSPRPY